VRARLALALGLAAAAATTLSGCGDEKEALRRALGDVEPVGAWIYDDLELGIAKAAETGKPLLAVFRCVT
jgi:hypothetical protein